jgi:hypothetical protein
MTVMTRRFRLRGVHFLYDEKYNEPKHGHEYELLVSVKAGVDSHFVEAIVAREILAKWDKKDFMKLGLAQASGELLVEEFDRSLRASELNNLLVGVTLKETRKNRFISAKSDLSACE